MSVTENKFSQLIKQAMEIDESITQQMADEFGISIATLERWAVGESVPQPDVRLSVLQRTTSIMLSHLGKVMEQLK